MRESLEKMLAKGVDNPLLRFGLGKAWLDEGNGAEAAVHLARCVEQDPSTPQRGSYWAKRISCRVTWRQRAGPGKTGSWRRRPMGTSRPRRRWPCS